MQGPSTARFMAIWALAMAPFSAATPLIVTLALKVGGYGRLQVALLQAVITYLLAIAAGVVQGTLLSRLRVRVPFWGLAVALGSLAGVVLGTLASTQLLAISNATSPAVASWIASILWSSTFALSLAVAEGFALWGRRWPSDALLWVAGLLTLRVLPMLALRLVPERAGDGTELLSRFAFSLVNGTLIAAGTAWLLDRLVFRRPAAEA